jgi:NTP pyrophosphatase (non-canonical NTP hydrolase)
MTICDTCANAPLCRQRSYSMAKCSDYDPVFNAIETAVNTYGIEKQLTVFFGEIGELMTAVADCRRGRDTSDHVAEEMADVLICCKQVMYALGVTRRDVLQWQDHKLRRLAMRLAEQEAQSE